MIIGKDRTNMPVTSTEEMDNKLNKIVPLYRHNILLYDNTDDEFLLTIISIKSNNYVDATLSQMVNNIYADEGLVSMFFSNESGTFKAVVTEYVDNQDHTIEINYGASSSIRFDDTHQTFDERIELL